MNNEIMTSKKIIRTAVIGVGRIAWHFHLPSIASHKGFELAAVVDPEPDRLEDVRRKYGQVKCFTNTTEMYANGTYDLVVIASPTCFHFDQLREAFANGCDVFCDKPLASQYEECVSVVEAMKRQGRKLMVYQPHRITNVAMGLKKVVESGLLGKVYMVKRAECNFTRRDDWQAWRKNGGGMLNNYGAHFIDQLLHVFGGKCRDVNCITRQIATLGDAEDVVRVTLQTDQDVILDIDINMAAAHPIAPWRVYGDRGAAWINAEENCWEVKYYEPDSLDTLLPQEGLCAANREYGPDEVIDWKIRQFPLADCVDVDFYDYCYDYFVLGKEPFVPVAETLEVMRVIHLCRSSNRQCLKTQEGEEVRSQQMGSAI